MAIARTQTDAISDIEIAKEDALSKKVKDKQDSQKTKLNQQKVEKKPGFLASTIAELKKVEWPGLRYVVNWSLTIILFTAVLSLLLGFVDHVFGASISYVNCVSPQNIEDKSSQQCRDEFVSKITLKN